MKNVSSLKSTKSESPKTPGGISKSLLTPCRRVGLSRNWRKSGPSPFISPLANSSTPNMEVKLEKKETRKRKERLAEEEIDVENVEGNVTPARNEDVVTLLPLEKSDNSNLVRTPLRNVIDLPRKKSKILLSTISEGQEEPNNNKSVSDDYNIENVLKTNGPQSEDYQNIRDDKPVDIITTPVKSKSKSKLKKKMSPKLNKEKVIQISDKHNEEMNSREVTGNLTKDTVFENIETYKQDKSPKELSKECIVVLQKKIFKTRDTNLKSETSELNSNVKKKCEEADNSVSQALFDSDSDEVPLINLGKKENKEKCPEIITIDDDDDFNATSKIKVKKLEDNTTSTGGLKSNLSKKKTAKTSKTNLPIPKIIIKTVEVPKSSQSSFDDDDEDFDYSNKRTILIRKTNEKVVKPSKAKTTGSITQQDIEELKERIEAKKKLLLAKAMTEDTAELRGLIKKWQQGCQNALMELMDLMRNKCPDKKNMAYAEMLQTLKIPSSLVGYDSENDCFNTPDNADIILAPFSDL